MVCWLKFQAWYISEVLYRNKSIVCLNSPSLKWRSVWKLHLVNHHFFLSLVAKTIWISLQASPRKLVGSHIYSCNADAIIHFEACAHKLNKFMNSTILHNKKRSMSIPLQRIIFQHIILLWLFQARHNITLTPCLWLLINQFNLQYNEQSSSIKFQRKLQVPAAYNVKNTSL